MEQNGRDLLIDRILDARTAQEIDAAEKAAHEWLDKNPGDIQIVAAQERLEKARAKLEDKERKAYIASSLAFAPTLLVVGFLTLAISGNWALATGVGLATGLWVASEVWQTLYENDPSTGDR